MIHFHIITLFPEIIEAYAGASLLKRAQKNKFLQITAINPRNFSADPHQSVDDRPYGGGPGMVLKAETILQAVETACSKSQSADWRTNSKFQKRKIKYVILSPQGKQFTNKYAAQLAQKYSDIVLIAGRYEGIDARVKKILKAEEVSVGPYVVTGGELPSLIIVDAVARQMKGVLGKEESLEETRIASSEMYTRPEKLVWKSKKYTVPKVLLSGDHKKIEEWRGKRSKKKKI